MKKSILDPEIELLEAKEKELKDKEKKIAEQEEAYFEILYDKMMLMIATNTLKSRSQFSFRTKIKDSQLANYKQRLKSTKPDMYKITQDRFQRYQGSKKLELAEQKSMSIVDNLDTDWLIKQFKKQIEEKVNTMVWEKVQWLLESMENDIVTAKALLIQSTMAGIIWYYNSITERVKSGERITTQEVRTLYDMFKVELWESTQIKETRSKSVGVKIVVWLEESEMKQILNDNKRQDLSISMKDVADAFKHKLQWNLPVTNINNGKVWWISEQVWVITETESVSDSSDT